MSPPVLVVPETLLRGSSMEGKGHVFNREIGSSIVLRVNLFVGDVLSVPKLSTQSVIYELE